MKMLIFLMIFPLIIAGLALVVPLRAALRKTIAVIAMVVLSVMPVYLLVTYRSKGPVYFPVESHLVNLIMLVIELGIAGYIVYFSLKSRRYLPVVLVILQSLVMVTFELRSGPSMKIDNSLFIDNFSIIMALIVGIIGSAICLYAIGYIPQYHEHHPEVKQRRRYFSFLMYLFLSAMFGIIFSNNLIWLYFFWEITTICSALLIGYRNDHESVNSMFRALNMNLLGGVVFAVGLVYLYSGSGIMELDKLVRLEQTYALLPAVCLAFAGLVKSAQLPFSSWLTGAMVAPTPVSALLHSSTMVKAGVYIILRVSPALENTAAAKMLILIGGVSFLVTAFIAISQSNAKKVLAYSTISNLGLIVACAGVNTAAALWSALLLIIFHAVAKSLLFLCVGVIEHNLGSRDIEDMDYLIMRLPKLTALMMTGMAGMFLAPFGMIISKFVTLKAFIDTNPGMAVILAYGSAATVFFWVKWMGKIMSIRHGVTEVMESRVSAWEWFTLGMLAICTVGVCLAFPFISWGLIDPYLVEIFGEVPIPEPFDIIVTALIMVGLIIFLPLGLFYFAFINKNYRRVGTYLGGGNIDNVSFEGAMASTRTIELKNYYLEKYFGEDRLFNIGVLVSLTLLFVMFGVALI